MQDSILRAFFNDQLNLAPQPNMTATEVIQRQEEKLRQLGPLLGRLQDELLRPLINRAFAILLRAGAFAEMPEELAAAGAINVRYSSPIAKTQRITEAQGILRWWEINAPLVEMKPEILDNIDPDALGRGSWNDVGLPADYLFDPKMVEQIRQVRAQQVQQAQQLEEMTAVTDAAAKLPE